MSLISAVLSLCINRIPWGGNMGTLVLLIIDAGRRLICRAS